MNKEVKTGVFLKGEESIGFDFYTDIDVADKLTFVNSVVDILVDGVNYNSVIRDLIFDIFIIEIFTLVDIQELMESSSFVKDVEQFLEDTNIVDVVKANMRDGLLEELNHAIDLNIQYRTGIHPNPLNDALAVLVNTLEKKVNGLDLNSMMNVAKLFANMTDEFTTENIVKAYIANNKDE